MLTLLLGLAAFAVDLGWFYLHATRVQRAADAAALAGVVHMPYDFDQAEIDATSLAGTNGYPVDADTSVTVEPVSGEQHQLQVTVEDTIQTFFLKVFGMNTQVIAQTARAEFIPPLPMGSPLNRFGDNPGCWPGGTPTGTCSNFWASIQGHYNGAGWGDLYSSRCRGWGNGTSCTGGTSPTGWNTAFRDRGYLYAIEVPSGATGNLTVQLFDPAFRPTSSGGASPIGDRYIQGTTTGPTVQYTLYQPTSTPLVLSSTSPVSGCSTSYAPSTWPGGTPGWTTLCTVSSSYGPGIYPLQVRIPQTNTRGHNRFSIRATAPGVTPRVYALGDMSIYATTSGVTEFYLAEVQPQHAGKTLNVELWDAGDASGSTSATVQVRGPGGTTYSCSWFSSKGDSGTSSTCSKTTAFGGDTVSSCTNCYNNHLLTLSVPLPTTYTCTTDCWWKIRYTYPSTLTVTDTTTWRAYIEGNPVHLVPSS
jgi:hypothetical protein